MKTYIFQRYKVFFSCLHFLSQEEHESFMKNVIKELKGCNGTSGKQFLYNRVTSGLGQNSSRSYGISHHGLKEIGQRQLCGAV